jgi:ethanolamine utilization microcompartment shell protein EutL
MKILEYEDLTKTIREERAALADAHAALAFALVELENMTSDQFANGADKAIRARISAVLDRAGYSLKAAEEGRGDL